MSYEKNCTIHIISDNTTAVAHINKMGGGVKSTTCNDVAYKIWCWCETRSIWLYATHILGQDNEVADSLSRNFSPSVEWDLNNDIFAKIVEELELRQ